MIRRYYRVKKNGQEIPRGLVVADLHKDILTMGWSCLHKGDSFNKKLAYAIATDTVVNEVNNNIRRPDDFDQWPSDRQNKWLKRQAQINERNVQEYPKRLKQFQVLDAGAVMRYIDDMPEPIRTTARRTYMYILYRYHVSNANVPANA